MSARRSEFTTLSKLKALARYIRCPGVFELGIKCGKQFGSLSEIEFDHIKRCEIEADNSPENARPLCAECHRAKTNRKDTVEAKKGRNLRGENKPKESRPLAGSRASGWRKPMNGPAERRT